MSISETLPLQECDNMATTMATTLFQTDKTVPYVRKRDGSLEEVDFGKCQNRMRTLATMKPELHNVSTTALAQQVILNICDGIETRELDELAARICAEKTTTHPDYGILASRIAISNHHKNTSPSFSETVQILWDNNDSSGKHCPVLAKYFYDLVMKNKEKLNSVINYNKDFEYSYFGFKTLERAYLLRKNDRVIERPQQMLLRVSLAMYRDDIKSAIKVYKHFSEGNLTPASPTLYNFGTNREQGSSCFLLTIGEDSIDGIYKTIKDCAHISKYAGGIGISITPVRAKGSRIRGTNGKSDGILPMLKVFNETARYVNQSGKRKGSFAVYIEPWHADIEEFAVAKRNIGAETERARDLFYAIWTPDLFMERIQEDGKWTLMCPDECPGLIEAYGDDFKELYERYEAEGRGRKTIQARDLWRTIVTTQIETGVPYICFKDAVNKKNNQKNLGTINCSNLCSEIVEYSSKTETATCNLTSIALPKCVEYPYPTEQITVYSKDDCKFCVFSKNLLNHRGIPYKEILLNDTTARNKFFQGLNKDVEDDENLIMSVPQIFVGKERIGGFQELEKYLTPTFNFSKLQEIANIATRNLNKVIDYTFYPVPEAKYSNVLHRPIGVGVQGLADVFAMMRMAFDSEEARELNRKMSYHIYYAAVEASMDLARKRKKNIHDYRRLQKELNKLEKGIKDDDVAVSTDLLEQDEKTVEEPKKSIKRKSGKQTVDTKAIIRTEMENMRNRYHIIEEELALPSQFAGAYSSFVGSNTYEGKLQYDLWGATPPEELREDFDRLKDSIKKHGLRNSLLIAYMPTAGTSQILNNNECIEAFTSNIYKRNTMAGEFKIINRHLINDLIILDLWNDDMKQTIVQNRGSIQNIQNIPKKIKDMYKEVYELSQKAIINMAADRGEATCQTQSMNIFIGEATFAKMNAMLFYGWQKGLKTGMYYLRSRERSHAQNVSISAERLMGIQQQSEQNFEDDICVSCSA